MMQRHAVICARGGSKRVPGKNLLELNGKPLLHYSIAAARDCGLFDHVIVNSEDERILSVARDCGAITYERPLDYAGGRVFLIDVVREMIQTSGWGHDDEVAVLFPTVPLRTSEDIVAAHALFVEQGRQAPVVSVCKYEYPIHMALEVGGDGRLGPVFSEQYRKSTRHDDQQVTYRANYAVIWNTAGRLLTQEKLIGPSPIPYHMPLERSVDIDEDYQVRVAELLLASREES